MQFEVNVSDVAGITLQLRSYSQVIHAANVRLPWPSPVNCLVVDVTFFTSSLVRFDNDFCF